MNPEIGGDRDSSFKKLRLLYACLLITIPLYVYAGEYLAPARPGDNRIISLSLVPLAVFNTWYVLSSCRRAVAKASDFMRSHDDDPFAMRRWFSANVVSLTSSEPLALYGWILRVFGGTLLQAVPFYACALLLLLISTPRRVHVSASVRGPLSREN
jgi:hypothetical protein